MRNLESVAEFRALVGQALGTSEWRVVDQDIITAFAELTDDRQWIHLDPERAAEAGIGSTIAHGFLTLSLIPSFLDSIYRIERLSMGINYGLNRVRFPATVPAGSRLRGRAELSSYDGDDRRGTAMITVTIERESTDRPVCVAELLVRLEGAADTADDA